MQKIQQIFLFYPKKFCLTDNERFAFKTFMENNALQGFRYTFANKLINE